MLSLLLIIFVSLIFTYVWFGIIHTLIFSKFYNDEVAIVIAITIATVLWIFYLFSL